ncbi:MAG: hypothetical protein A2V67_00860 [Deltaproteobacteria bacterium RBG_13_61_14]|nr:MAG: hypothetical protein A2V67_00860 [Deltaproteobacteria bacterium RBG_13_61_14]
MNLFKKWLLVSMVIGLLVFAYALAQEAGGGAAAEPSTPSYGPGTVPTIPGTNVPVPAGEGAAPPPEAGSDAAGPGEEGAGGDAPGTYVERRKDQLVFESSCLKCHPKEKILKRRTEAQWKEIVLKKHLMLGRIFSSDAAPVLRYLNGNYGIKPQPAAPVSAAQPQPPAPMAQPGATSAPPPAPTPEPPPKLDQ